MRAKHLGWPLALCVIAAPSLASGGYFEGQTEPLDGKQACAGGGMRVTFQVTPDGEVLGGAVTFQASRDGEVRDGGAIPISSDGFHGALGRDGALHASFHAGHRAEMVTIDGVVSGDRFDGVVQRADCRFRLILNRR
jgi:hypothetical protein